MTDNEQPTAPNKTAWSIIRTALSEAQGVDGTYEECSAKLDDIARRADDQLSALSAVARPPEPMIEQDTTPNIFRLSTLTISSTGELTISDKKGCSQNAKLGISGRSIPDTERLTIALEVLAAEKDKAVVSENWALAADLRSGEFRLERIRDAARVATPDSERLDWLLNNPTWVEVAVLGMRSGFAWSTPLSRAAIDAARVATPDTVEGGVAGQSDTETAR